jgi:hypothetical protein
MSDSFIRHRETLFEDFEKESSRCEDAEKELQVAWEGHNMVGQAYMVRDPYQANHDANETRRCLWQEAINERNALAARRTALAETMLGAVLSCREQEYTVSPELIGIYRTACAVRRGRTL